MGGKKRHKKTHPFFEEKDNIRPFLKGFLEQFSLTFLVSSYCLMGFLTFFHVLSSISLVKNKKIQALAKFYVFLTQQIECKNTHQGRSRHSSFNNLKAFLRPSLGGSLSPALGSWSSNGSEGPKECKLH